MHSTSIVTTANSCYPLPNRFLLPPLCNSRNPNLLSVSYSPSSSSSSSPLRATHHRSQKQRQRHRSFDNTLPFYQFSSPTDDTGFAKQSSEGLDSESRQPGFQSVESGVGVLSNMWWTDLKAAVGQRINVEGIVSSAAVLVRDRHLVLPHISVPDIRYIDWGELKRKGFKGVVFDKDNTLTVPYSLALWPPVGSSIERCKAVFGHDIAVFSNSAGLAEYDHDGSKARALEAEIGIRVLRHRVKKPAGTAEEVEKHFGCASSQLIMVGDRPFTDIVYGNRNGFLTILTEPLSQAEEPFIVRQVRKIELILLNHWTTRGLKPAGHNLLPDATQCVTDPSNL